MQSHNRPVSTTTKLAVVFAVLFAAAVAGVWAKTMFGPKSATAAAQPAASASMLSPIEMMSKPDRELPVAEPVQPF